MGRQATLGRRGSSTSCNRLAIRGSIELWMREHCPGDGVDALLSRPLDALKMAIEVGREVGKLRPGSCLEASIVGAIHHAEEDEIEAVNSICRAAMNGRKRGELRAHQSSSSRRKEG